jgi:hypothetical protein
MAGSTQGSTEPALHRLREACLSLPDARERLSHGEPTWFAGGGKAFVPPYVGGRGWVGVRLDVPGVDWDLVYQVVHDAYRTVASRALLRLLDPP